MIFCVVFFPLSCNDRRVAVCCLGGAGQEAQQLQLGHFHRVKGRCVLFAATLGRCHPAAAGAVLELVQPFSAL